MIQQCEHHRGQCIEFDVLLRLLYEILRHFRRIHEQFLFQSSIYRDYSRESGFVCPVEQCRRPGRPRFQIPQEAITSMHSTHRMWRTVAREIGVSYRTVLRRRHQYSLPVAGSDGPRATYSDVTDEQVCESVREILQLMPNAGESYVIGGLRSRGIHIQRWRIRQAINVVDPISRALRRRRAITRRIYNVPCPNALW